MSILETEIAGALTLLGALVRDGSKVYFPWDYPDDQLSASQAWARVHGTGLELVRVDRLEPLYIRWIKHDERWSHIHRMKAHLKAYCGAGVPAGAEPFRPSEPPDPALLSLAGCYLCNRRLYLDRSFHRRKTATAIAGIQAARRARS